MKHVNLPTLSLFALLLAATAANAAPKTPESALESASATPYKQFFLVGGKQTDAATAIVQALNGQPAYKCVSVTAAISKAGTSIAIKNVKKPKAN